MSPTPSYGLFSRLNLYKTNETETEKEKRLLASRIKWAEENGYIMIKNNVNSLEKALKTAKAA